jgi:hypothetical protein
MKINLQVLFISSALLLNSVSFVIAQSISAGAGHSSFVCSSGYARATGLNAFGQLGNGTLNSTSTPGAVNNLTGIIATSSRDQFTLFLKNDSTVWAVGNNSYGQFGNGTTTNSSTAVQIPNLTGIIKIAAGINHSLFLKSDSTVWSCGRNLSGELGDGTQTQRVTPVQITGLTGIIDIAAGDLHSMFLRVDSIVWTCGDNQNGALGLGNGAGLQVLNPTQVTAISGVTGIAGGYRHSLFIKQNSTVWACGFNNAGQLGDGTTTSKDVPVQISTLSGIKGISAGQQHSLFVSYSGTVWATGANSFGQLGNGTNNDSNTPVLVSGISGITQVTASGLFHSLFLKSNNTFWACGQNNQGQLGDGTSVNRYTPIQVIDGCITSSIIDINSNISTLVNPNPSNGFFNLQVNATQFENYTVEIYNPMGEIVYYLKTQSANNSIDLSNETKGLYFYKIRNDQNGLMNGKVIIN